jgi:hypothetical protein
MKIANKSFGNVTKIKYVGITPLKITFMRELG